MSATAVVSATAVYVCYSRECVQLASGRQLAVL
jgi:hypothetical protein